MVCRDVSYVPGLLKIFDEILMNAADNKRRDESMSILRVDISVERNLITIYNNGRGIPVEKDKDEDTYLPELMLGHLLTSSAYDDSLKRTGRNGYGAKLTNIFSKKFTVDTADGKKKYIQVWFHLCKEEEDSHLRGSLNYLFGSINSAC